MNQSSEDPAIVEADAALKSAESRGIEDLRVAQCLDQYAELLKRKKVRALDAANMTARAKVIRVAGEIAWAEQALREAVISFGPDALEVAGCLETLASLLSNPVGWRSRSETRAEVQG